MFAWSNLLRITRTRVNGFIKFQRHFTTTRLYREKDKESREEQPNLAGSAASKYEVFADEKTPIIFDVEKEREKYYEINEGLGRAEKKYKDFSGINSERGVTGVMEIDELVSILHKENAKDIFVVNVPKELTYTDYLVIVTCRSKRHMAATAEFVRSVYKYKTNSSTEIPLVEGQASKDWQAIDLGNIALHLMLKSTREYYDLETLWTVGQKFDKKCNETPDFDILDYESILSKLNPTAKVS